MIAFECDHFSNIGNNDGVNIASRRAAACCKKVKALVGNAVQRRHASLRTPCGVGHFEA
ncbi:hypothetical protein [Burkholderia vietnamiensis]|uniref:hypothetical protein n=1 Tax=Burkholderia vietnamiensis TaxID=60552 RepID=UPI001CF372C0|nr:hypothetical protein [Burkholderia vietnamiensis]MCA7983956.1 hypothetical protein [Burkholderia vietnamiensis]